MQSTCQIQKDENSCNSLLLLRVIPTNHYQRLSREEIFIRSCCMSAWRKLHSHSAKTSACASGTEGLEADALVPSEEGASELEI